MKKLFQMKNLELLNKKYFSIIFFCLFFGSTTQSQELVDIWKIEGKKTNEDSNVIKSVEEKKNY